MDSLWKILKKLVLLILMTQNQPHQPISLKEIKNDLDEDPLKEENLNEVVKDEDKTVVKKEQFDEANDYHHSKSMVEVKIENDDEVFDENDYNYYEAEQSDYQYT